MRDPARFLFVQLDTVAAGPGGLVLAGGDKGVFASTDGEHYSSRSQTEFTETVALPSTWLFVSGTHEISVVSEGEPSS